MLVKLQLRNLAYFAELVRPTGMFEYRMFEYHSRVRHTQATLHSCLVPLLRCKHVRDTCLCLDRPGCFAKRRDFGCGTRMHYAFFNGSEEQRRCRACDGSDRPTWPHSHITPLCTQPRRSSRGHQEVLRPPWLHWRGDLRARHHAQACMVRLGPELNRLRWQLALTRLPPNSPSSTVKREGFDSISKEDKAKALTSVDTEHHLMSHWSYLNKDSCQCGSVSSLSQWLGMPPSSELSCDQLS